MFRLEPIPVTENAKANLDQETIERVADAARGGPLSGPPPKRAPEGDTVTADESAQIFAAERAELEAQRDAEMASNMENLSLTKEAMEHLKRAPTTPPVDMGHLRRAPITPPVDAEMTDAQESRQPSTSQAPGNAHTADGQSEFATVGWSSLYEKP